MSFDFERSTPELAGHKIWSVGYPSGLGDGEEFKKYVDGYYNQMEIQQRMAIETAKIPNFHEIFPANQRSLFLGRFSNNLRATDTGVIPVDITAWLGLSGAMVGMFVEDLNDSSKWVPKIVGM
ncbi:MAG: hypothetical protein Q9187_008716, partial [Circinaria calcarea]